VTKVLYVEHNDDNIYMLKTRLELVGDFEVLAVEDSEKGCELAVTEHPDVILMDLEMPDIDRWEPVRRLKSDPQTPRHPDHRYVRARAGASESRPFRLLKSWPELQIRITQLAREESPPPLAPSSGEVVTEFQSDSSPTDSPVRVLCAQPRSRSLWASIDSVWPGTRCSDRSRMDRLEGHQSQIPACDRSGLRKPCHGWPA
jgi:CheY-like chemotaxis protein